MRLGMLDADFKDKAGIPLTARGTFIISPDKRIKFHANYPGALGRNFDEVRAELLGLCRYLWGMVLL